MNTSYTNQDSEHRIWWSGQSSYTPAGEEEIILWAWAIVTYDPINDVVKGYVRVDEPDPMPTDIDYIDLEDWVEGTFSREESGFSTWEAWFSNPNWNNN